MCASLFTSIFSIFQNKFWFLQFSGQFIPDIAVITYQCLDMVYYGIFLVANTFFQKLHLILIQSLVFCGNLTICYR